LLKITFYQSNHASKKHLRYLINSMKKNPVIAIGLDSADPELIEQWMAQGHLKTLSALHQKGIYSRLNNRLPLAGSTFETSSTEKLWTMFWTGCLPSQTGFWNLFKFRPDAYGVDFNQTSAYDYQAFLPFYALGDPYRVVAFDPPYSVLSEQVNGLQILGWGGHFPSTFSHSQPDELLPEIVQTYGKNPVLLKDHGSWWNAKYRKWLDTAVQNSITSRAKICQDLLQRDQWDLFLTVFSESHSVGHGLYHMSDTNHPLYPRWHEKGNNPVQEAFKSIDQAIADILSVAPANANIICYSLHGLAINYTDLLSMTFLPELLYRWNFPGKTALPPHRVGQRVPPLITHLRRNTWPGELWSSMRDPHPLRQWVRRWLPGRFLHSLHQPDIISPFELDQQSHPISWLPTVWYSPLWPQMKAFALPSFSEGWIRINLKGREAQGIIEPEDYDTLCDELAALAHSLKDARSGKPLVKQVVRTRKSADDQTPNLPDADLVIVWNEVPTDVVESKMGVMGPVPYPRPGGHREQGFVFVSGPDIDAAAGLMENPQSLDLTPTILQLIGAPIPDYMDGKVLLPSLTFQSV
jgi:predicted AlkP superfamily phosphohydrolase/phosphomutase